MLAKRVIPCLDVKNGVVVKGTNFANLRDVGDPAELARRYAEQGADEIVLLDITASSENRSTRLSWIQKVHETVNVPFTVGGGIRTLDDVRDALQSGADKVSINTAALADPALVTRASEEFGAQCIVACIDAKRENGAWRVYSHGGKRATGRDALEWARACERLGAGELLVTSIDRDGTREGYDLALLRGIAAATRLPLIASGGAGAPEHFAKALQEGCADAALAASLFHSSELSIPNLKKYLISQGVAIRPVSEKTG